MHDHLRLVLEPDPRRAGVACVCAYNLNCEVTAALTGPRAARWLRVRVIGPRLPRGEDLPDVSGHCEPFNGGIRFVPQFPFDTGVRYLASIDTAVLDRTGRSKTLTLEFGIPDKPLGDRPGVTQIFPSGDSLPENLLRFYVQFSNPMQRGRAEEQIKLLGPDRRPVSDALYRPPVELWDRSMRHLTVLLDPGRLKRGVGPNRELGPPLSRGQVFTLDVGSGMRDVSGQPMREAATKPFLVTDTVREPISPVKWKLIPPELRSRRPLKLQSCRQLDWALLWHSLSVVAEGGEPIGGRTAIEEYERTWSFTPAAPWAAGTYRVRIAPTLEDVCGNSMVEAFDRPLRSAGALRDEQRADFLIPFHLGP